MRRVWIGIGNNNPDLIIIQHLSVQVGGTRRNSLVIIEAVRASVSTSVGRIDALDQLTKRIVGKILFTATGRVDDPYAIAAGVVIVPRGIVPPIRVAPDEARA